MDNPWYFTTYGFLCNNRKFKCYDEGKSHFCQDDLYIASTTPQEILNMLKDKYKNNMYLQGKYLHDPGGRDICQIKEYLEKLYEKS